MFGDDPPTPAAPLGPKNGYEQLGGPEADALILGGSLRVWSVKEDKLAQWERGSNQR